MGRDALQLKEHSMSTATISRTGSETPIPSQSRRRRARNGSFASTFTVNALLILGCAYMVLPVVWLFFASTKNTADL